METKNYYEINWCEWKLLFIGLLEFKEDEDDDQKQQQQQQQQQ